MRKLKPEEMQWAMDQWSKDDDQKRTTSGVRCPNCHFFKTRSSRERKRWVGELGKKASARCIVPMIAAVSGIFVLPAFIDEFVPFWIVFFLSIGLSLQWAYNGPNGIYALERQHPHEVIRWTDHNCEHCGYVWTT